MSASNRRIDELKVVSPCSSDWGRMPGDEKKRFCVECNKFVYDFSQMTRRQVEAIVSIHRGRMCARITRRPDGSLLTLETPPAHPVVARRASPVVNATLAAILGLSVPANVLNVDVSAAQLIARSDADGKGARTPYGGGEALVGGTVFDPQGAVIPNAVAKLISDAGAELETKTSGEGEFTFAQVPFGSYIMLVEAQGFYMHVNSNVIVDTPYDTHFEVTMKVKPGPINGGAMFSPLSLLDLYQQSAVVAIAHIGQSTLVEGEDGAKRLKTALRVTSQFKGDNNQQVIPFYHWIDDSYPTTLKPGDRLLVFLRRRESEDGRRLDGYEATGWEDSIKKLDDGALAAYRQRIEELTAIFQGGDPDPAGLVEWLVRCVEDPATRWDGVSNLIESLYALESERERENEAKSKAGETEESDDQAEDDEEDSSERTDEPDPGIDSVKLATALTQEHKARLANTLFAIAELSESDMGLVNLIQELGDERLAPYLLSQLRRMADRAPRHAERLIWIIARIINDQDIKMLAHDYGDAAGYDKSEYDGESDQQDSAQNQRADGLTVAAIKRSAMLKDFLKLVEYKSKRERGVGSGE
jgi:carboxypeptidase family protein